MKNSILEVDLTDEQFAALSNQTRRTGLSTSAPTAATRAARWYFTGTLLEMFRGAGTLTADSLRASCTELER